MKKLTTNFLKNNKSKWMKNKLMKISADIIEIESNKYIQTLKNRFFKETIKIDDLFVTLVKEKRERFKMYKIRKKIRKIRNGKGDITMHTGKVKIIVKECHVQVNGTHFGDLSST